MQILMLTSSYPKYPGETTAPFIEEIAAGVAQRGHEVHVLAPYHPELRRAPIERGVHLHFFRYAPHPALNIWGYAASQRGDVRLKAAALVVAPLALAATVASLMRTLNQRSARSSFLAHRSSLLAPHSSFDLIHAHWVLPNAPPAALVAGLWSLPLVVSLHGSDVSLAERHWATAGAAGFTFRQAAAVTACSDDLRNRAVHLGARPVSSSVIPYGVDLQGFAPHRDARAQVRAELHLPNDAPLVLALGRLVYKKGFDVLLAAWPRVLAQHPQARLAIVGDGDLRDELKVQATALGLGERVTFVGQLNRARTAAYLGSADVFAVPSVRDQSGNVDGLPNTLLEGMAAARPIVATRLAGIPQVINDGVHGLLVPEKDPLALAAAITQLLDDPIRAASLGAAAQQRVASELTWDATAARFEQVYRSVKRET